MANTLSVFDRKKIERLAKKASDKFIERATAYLWKVARNSVKKTASREKKHDLNIYLGRIRKGGRDQPIDTDTIEKAKKYLSSPKRNDEQIVRRDTMRDILNPKTQGSVRVKKPSRAGQPPKSHKTSQKGWRDFWLKEGIRFDPKAGTVFLNPSRFDNGSDRTKRIPALIEEGGDTISHAKVLRGYYVFKTYYKNGKTKVSYSPTYHKIRKRYHMKPRPFLVPALIKAAEHLIKILENSIGK